MCACIMYEYMHVCVHTHVHACLCTCTCAQSHVHAQCACACCMPVCVHMVCVYITICDLICNRFLFHSLLYTFVRNNTALIFHSPQTLAQSSSSQAAHIIRFLFLPIIFQYVCFKSRTTNINIHIPAALDWVGLWFADLFSFSCLDLVA